MKRTAAHATARIAIILAGVLALGACSSNQAMDVEGVEGQNADSYVLINNLDTHPNLVIVCHEGVAIMTSSREYGDAITRVPEWDADCPPATDELEVTEPTPAPSE